MVIKILRNKKNQCAKHRPKKLQINLVAEVLSENGLTSIFWEINVPNMSEAEFKTCFRMDRSNFQILCESLDSLNTSNRHIGHSKRVAIALYALGSSAERRTIAKLFGVSLLSVARILKDFCEAVWQEMKAKYMGDFPLTEESIRKNVSDFEEKGFPQCLGALDGSHINVTTRNPDYANYKNGKSIVLLALVDARYRFMYVNIGCPVKSYHIKKIS